nr:hypothetical protein [Sphingosinicella terrae]
MPRPELLVERKGRRVIRIRLDVDGPGPARRRHRLQGLDQGRRYARTPVPLRDCQVVDVELASGALALPQDIGAKAPDDRLVLLGNEGDEVG